MYGGSVNGSVLYFILVNILRAIYRSPGSFCFHKSNLVGEVSRRRFKECTAQATPVFLGHM